MKQFAIFLFSAMVFSSCVKNNPKPAWLTLANWQVVANPSPFANDAGELTQNFTDAWVYVDGKLIGTFELPCTIPVLMSGNKEVRIYPTVRNNGISATKKIYPFCDAYKITLDLVEGQTYNLTPVTQYATATHFWIEDFEDFAVQLETDANSNATLVRENSSDIAISGYYGHIHLNSTTDSLWQATTSSMVLPQGGAEVYMEIDYRNDNNLVTGVFAFSSSLGNSQHINIGFNPQPTATMVWKKIYIDLKEIVSYNSTADYYKQYFRALIDSGELQGDIYIDNIKVVYF